MNSVSNAAQDRSVTRMMVGCVQTALLTSLIYHCFNDTVISLPNYNALV